MAERTLRDVYGLIKDFLEKGKKKKKKKYGPGDIELSPEHPVGRIIKKRKKEYQKYENI